MFRLSKRKKEIDEKIQEEMKETKEKKEPLDILGKLFEKDTDEEDKDKVLEILFEHPDIRKITDISHNEIIDLCVLLTFSHAMKELTTLKRTLIDDFCDNRLVLALSKARKSREEIVEIYKTSTFGEMGMFPEQQTNRRFGRFRDRVGL